VTQEIATRPVAEKAVTEGIEEALQRKVEGLKIDRDQWRLTASWAGGQATIATEEYGRSGFYLVGFWSGRLQVIIRRPWPLRDKRFIQKTKGRPWDFDAIADTIIEISAENVKHYAERESQATADAERDRLAREMRGDGVSVSASHGFPPGGDPACYSVSAGFLTESRALAVADVIRKVLTTIAILLLLAVPAAGQEDLTVTAGEGIVSDDLCVSTSVVFSERLEATGDIYASRYLLQTPGGEISIDEDWIRRIARDEAKSSPRIFYAVQPEVSLPRHEEGSPWWRTMLACCAGLMLAMVLASILSHSKPQAHTVETCQKCGAPLPPWKWCGACENVPAGEHLHRTCACGLSTVRACDDNGGKK